MDSITQTRDELLKALDKQHQDSIAVNENNRRLAEQQLMYKNEAAGSVYSGTPTFQRAQLATKFGNNLAKINEGYAKNTVGTWNQIQNTLDKITALNEAAVAYGGQPATLDIPVASTPVPKPTPFLMNGKYYTYENGILKEVR